MGNGVRSSVLKQRRRALLARTAAITVARYGLRKNGFVPTWPKSSGLNYVTRPQRQRRLLNSASPLANGPGFRLMTSGTGGMRGSAPLRVVRTAGQYRLIRSTNDC